jgi:hypothetical protein
MPDASAAPGPPKLAFFFSDEPVSDAGTDPMRCNEALRLNRRRAGLSPSESAGITVNERLQALRRSGRATYDPATSRWERQLTIGPVFPKAKDVLR